MINKCSINAHSSIKITGEKIIYFDPFLIKCEYHDADIIFITHNHYDHFSPDDIKRVIKSDTVLVVPKSIKNEVNKIFENVVSIMPDEKKSVLGIEFHGVPAYNNLKPFHPKSNKWLGYVVNLNDEMIYVAGDTDLTSDNKFVKCDVAFIPIGGKYTMDYISAVELVKKINPKTVIPTHYGEIVGDKEDGERFKKLLNDFCEVKILLK